MRNLLKPMDFRLTLVDGITCIDKFNMSPNYFNIFAELGLLLEFMFTLETKEFNTRFLKQHKSHSKPLSNSYK